MGDRTLDTISYHYDKVAQPTWNHSDSVASSEPLAEGTIYKQTRTGLVVQRCVALFNDRCTTYHDPVKKADSRTWVLDRGCELKPAAAEQLAPVKRGVRPKGTWAITAAVAGVDQHVLLYEVTIDWPASWAAVGYTTLVLAFEAHEEAVRWHGALARVLEALQAAKASSRQSTGKPGAAAPSPGAPEPFAAAAREASATGAAAAAGALPPASPRELVPAAGDVIASATAAAEDGGDDDVWADPGSDDESCSGSEDCAVRDAAADPDEERWVPYRQTNGVAIYYRPGEDKKAGAGEYMVSCTIRGRPLRVAAALMRLRGNTTILGPAAHAEVLQPADADCATGREVLRVVLTASGHAGFFCAPREIILERMRKNDEDGVIVIMFKSVDLPNEASCAQGTGGLYGSGLYRRPVRGSVAGGYTIAGLRGEGAGSRESLVTCIVKVDLGGVCGEGSWARPLAAAAGWTDSFLDRILMSVHLLRDEVEQRRFSVQPFKLVASAKARLNEEGTLVGGDPAAAAAAALAVQGSLTAAAALPHSGPSALFRPPARMASLRTSSSVGAAAGAASITPIGEEESDSEAPAAPASPGASAAAAAPLDIAAVQALASMDRKYWSEIHVPGSDAPFSVRGPTYLKDKKKMPGGQPAFGLGAVEMIVLPPPGTDVAGVPSEGVAGHVARFIPSIRQGGAPFSIIINLVVPGTPMLGLVAVFCADKHPSILGPPPARPMEQDHDWQPFDFVLHKFVYGTDETRNHMLKLIPHIASGSWMIRQSVGTTPVILGKALKTSYHCTPTYIEVDIDISANSVANYVTGMVRGATSTLDIDMGFVLEGTAPWELPECLLGAFRLTRLNCNAAAVQLDWSKELPVTKGGGGGGKPSS